MNKCTVVALALFSCIFSPAAFSQIAPEYHGTPDGAFPFEENTAENPCITETEYHVLEQRCAGNIALLHLVTGHPDNPVAVSLSWPLRAAHGLADCNYAGISAYVDQNTATGALSDYNCGTKTYDGHRGTDISIWPFPFYKMDSNQVEVIAAAAGTIIDKSDGNFDKNCATNSLTANYVVIQHADGSRALYFHLKKNSLTAKAIGQTVAVGEFLGVVGSSGNSSGPHLHFEVWSGSTNTTRIDPYSGPCNTLNANSWWANQKPYAGPEILKTSVHTTDAVLPACPATETPNEANCFSIPFQGPGLPAGSAKFYIFMRYETAGMTTNLSILNPDGSTFNSWTYTSTSSYSGSLKSWTKTLPVAPGTYTFQSSLNDVVCSKTFDIVNATIAAGGPTTFCQGNSVTLTASAGASYLWSTGATTSNITVSNAGSYTVTVTSASGCSAVSPATVVTVNPAPVASITAGGPTTFCQGNSVTLTASAGASYIWSTGAATSNITVSNTGSYTVTITSASGCSAVSPATAVTVNPAPVASITAGGPTTFCQGNSVTLTASAGASYIWSTGAAISNITVSNTGSYTVTVTSVSGCSAVSPATAVTVNPLPMATITAGGPTTFCQGNSVTLTASSGSSYLWSTGATTSSITVSNTGSYTVTVTSVSGCTAASPATMVTVNPLPVATITAGGPTTFCQGNSVTLTASAGASYLWSTGATTSNITVSNTGSYTVTVNSASGCTAASPATAVTVNPLPVASITAGGPTTFCQGNSVTLTASSGSSYLWSTGATTSGITVSNTGSYTVTVTSASGCSAVSPATAVTVNPLPVASITAGGPTTFCQGNSVTLTASAGASYLWSTGATTSNITVSNTGSYTVTVTSASGCTAVSPATAVTVNPLPPLPVIIANGATLMSSAFAGNQWYLNGVILPGATGQMLQATQNGSYSVQVTNANGCTATSAPFNFMSTGIETIQEKNNVVILPNPNNGSFTVTVTAENTAGGVLEVYNLTGQKIATSEIRHPETDMDISTQPNGVYFVRLSLASGKRVVKLMKI